jgi:restriction system protein
MPHRRRRSDWLWDFSPRKPTKRELQRERRREVRAERAHKQTLQKWFEAERRRRQQAADHKRHQIVMSVRDYSILTPSQFERFVAELFERDGYMVEHRGGAGDQGCDLKMWKDDSIFVVQCKKYADTRPVGPAIVREFETVIRRHKAKHGWVVTTSSFSPGAYQAVPGGDKMTLIDRGALDEMVLRLINPEIRTTGEPALASNYADTSQNPRPLPNRTSTFPLSPTQASILIGLAILGSCVLGILACVVFTTYSQF